MLKDKTSQTPSAMPDVHRRQLLRGLSAVPVVATLTPVSSSAVSLLCTDPSLPAPGLPAGVAGFQPGGTGTPLYQCTAENATVGGTPAGQSTTILDPLDTAGDGMTLNAPVLDTSGTAAVATPDSATTRECAIYYIEGTGNLTFQSNAGGASPIAASCMISLGLTQL